MAYLPSRDCGPRYVVAKFYKHTGLALFSFYDRDMAELAFGTAEDSLATAAELYDARDGKTLATFGLHTAALYA